MFKNLNELLSFIAILLIFYFALKFFIGSFFINKKKGNKESFFDLMKNYSDNQED